MAEKYTFATHSNVVYVAGNFTQAGNVAATNIASWDGTNWSSLASGLHGDPIHGGVYGLVSIGGALYVAGNFTKAGFDVTQPKRQCLPP